MIHKYTDEELLDFLMTSDFNEKYTEKELKYLLIKYRYFYRLLYGKKENKIVDLQGKIRELEYNINNLKQENYKILVENAKQADIINNYKHRKLSFKERWFGKTILK
ncbi:MAG: hypothetical protein M0R46_12825 [Candidatus Muirbacterium halophilum]|nr:hypothetical protein [Candidatus Muirbacterium halophilum]